MTLLNVKAAKSTEQRQIREEETPQPQRSKELKFMQRTREEHRHQKDPARAALHFTTETFMFRGKELSIEDVFHVHCLFACSVHSLDWPKVS